MGIIQEIADVRNVTDLRQLAFYISLQFKNIIENVNGNLTFKDNVRCQVVSVTFPGAAQTTLTVAHGLGFIPNGFYIIDKSATLDVWRDPSLLSSKTSIFLKCNIASATVKLFFF